MIRWLIGLLGGAAERRLGDLLLAAAAAGVVALFAAVSLGFGTFAVYVYLRASQGRVVAALIICAAYGATAIAIWAIGMARRRARRLRLAAMASASAPVADIDSLLLHLVAAGAQQEQLALARRCGWDASFRRCSFLRWRSSEDLSRGKNSRSEAISSNQDDPAEPALHARVGARMAPSDARFCAGASEARRASNAAPLSSNSCRRRA